MHRITKLRMGRRRMSVQTISCACDSVVPIQSISINYNRTVHGGLAWGLGVYNDGTSLRRSKGIEIYDKGLLHRCMVLAKVPLGSETPIQISDNPVFQARNVFTICDYQCQGCWGERENKLTRQQHSVLPRKKVVGLSQLRSGRQES